jgi:hypothetical protein
MELLHDFFAWRSKKKGISYAKLYMNNKNNLFVLVNILGFLNNGLK